MPLPVAHGFLGASLVAFVHPKPNAKKSSPVFWGVFLGIVSDFDFLLAWMFDDRTLHRGFSHSIGLGLILFVCLLSISGAKKARASAAYSLALGLHGFLDFATTKEGSKIQILWPFLSQRFKLGLFGLSEKSSEMSAIEVVHALGIELMIFAPVFFIILHFRNPEVGSKK